MNLSHNSFVGRRREMSELTSVLDEALSGHGQLVMIVGEPGIGKTRTAQELADIAEQRGVQVLWGRCYEGEGAPPYWPWVQSLRSYIQQRDAAQLGSEMGAGAADIAEVIPEVRAKLPDLGPLPSLEPEQARFRLFDSIATFLKNVAQTQPLMIVMDDLHWADRSTLLLLEFMTHELDNGRLFILGAYRDVDISRGHPLSQSLGNLIREQSFQRIYLKGITQQEVGMLVDGRGGSITDPTLIEALHTRTEGNPFFVEEVLRLIERESGKEWDSGIPEGIKEVIGKRLDSLSAYCNRTLAVATVVGREFDFRILSSLMEDEEELLEALDQALEAHVIEASIEPEHYQFSHSLVHETLLADLSPSRKVRLHARIAEALENLYGDEDDAHAGELAHHFYEARTVAGSDKLVHYSIAAGERTLSVFAYEEAQSHFERALLAREGRPMDDELAAILSGLGRSRMATATEYRAVQDAWETMSRAFDYYAEVGDAAHAVELAVHPVATVSLSEQERPAQMASRALELVPRDSIEAGLLICRYARSSYLDTGNYERAQQALQNALGIAEQWEDATLEARALVTGAANCCDEMRYQEALERSLRAIELGYRLGNPQQQVRADYAACLALLGLGRNTVEARQHAQSALHIAEQLRDRSLIARSLEINELIAYSHGDWTMARQFSNQGLEISPEESLLLIRRALLEYETGDNNQGELYLERLLESTNMSVFEPNTMGVLAVPMVSRITDIPSRFRFTRETVEQILVVPDIPRWQIVLGRIALGFVAIDRDDVGLAEQQYSALSSYRNTFRNTFLSYVNICIDRLQGLLARMINTAENGTSHFEDAYAFCRNAGYRPELAWTCHDYAETLLQRNARGDHQKAISLLDETLAISTELGMKPLMERALALKEKAESLPTKAPMYPDGLTAREVDVLRLIAAGKTDREIAEELFISIRTVGNHVHNILNKTTTTNRAEAAAYATRHNLA